MSVLSRTMLWLSAMLLVAGMLPGAVHAGAAGSSNEISLHQIDGRQDASWHEACVALPADSEEDITAPCQDMVEAGDGIGLFHTSLFGRLSHRLARGLVIHQAFAERPVTGAKHARAPPSMRFA